MNETDLRNLILEAAGEVPDIGPLAQTIKWGQPSFAPSRPGIGSSVRIQANGNGTYGLMFICHAGLVERFRGQYAGELEFDGDRAIVVDPARPFDRVAAKHCVAQALTFKLKR
ncbi:MAG: DUF1801 domain-containing protein [Rhizobiaceae bacterium]